MKVGLFLYRNQQFTVNKKNDIVDPMKTSLVLAFGNKNLILDEKTYPYIKDKFPNAQILLCSTAGEIFDQEVYNDSVSLSAFEFDSTRLDCKSIRVNEYENSFEAGKALVNEFDQTGLKYLLVLSDGSVVNGSELVRGMGTVCANRFPITGGLAGDGTAFHSTAVALNNDLRPGNIVAVGFYGDKFHVGHGSMGGWETFGPERLITRSTANKLFEIEHKSALELYKTYLGKYADQLPGSALLFPLSVMLNDNDEPIVRTILSIDEATNSMTFAGDVPEGSMIRFMKANFDKVIDAANTAAEQSLVPLKSGNPKYALLISCVGRKIVLGQRVEEEVEMVAATMGSNTLLSGFYSYGEISPLQPNAKCQLLNQTMTITTFEEL